MSRIMINGVSADYVHAQDRGLAYGDGLFETIALVNNQLQFWQQHMQRMREGADKLDIPFPGAEQFLADIKKLTQQQDAGDCTIKCMLTRGISERGYAYNKGQHATRIVMISPLPDRPGVDDSINVCVCQHRISSNPSLAGMKHLNRLDNVLARAECGKDFYEGLMLDEHDQVIEGTMSNVFAVKDGQLYTPGLERSGVNGVMRAQIIELAAQHDIKLNITELTLASLLKMDECFLSNSLIGIVSVNCLQQTHYNTTEMATYFQTQLAQRIRDHVETIS